MVVHLCLHAEWSADLVVATHFLTYFVGSQEVRGGPTILMNIRAETFSMFSCERNGVTTALISEKPLSHSALLIAVVSTACLSFRRDLCIHTLAFSLKSL